MRHFFFIFFCMSSTLLCNTSNMDDILLMLISASSQSSLTLPPPSTWPAEPTHAATQEIDNYILLMLINASSQSSIARAKTIYVTRILYGKDRKPIGLLKVTTPAGADPKSHCTFIAN